MAHAYSDATTILKGVHHDFVVSMSLSVNLHKISILPMHSPLASSPNFPPCLIAQRPPPLKSTSLTAQRSLQVGVEAHLVEGAEVLINE